MYEEKSLIYRLAETYEQHRREQHALMQEQDRQLRQPGRLHRFSRWLLPNGGTLILIALLIATQSIWAQPFAATTNAPGPSATTVNYQGRLADNLGTPLDGNYGMSFALYDAASAGNLVWGPEVHDAVPVSDGLFSVGLGSRTAGGIPTTTWNGDRYLEITVGGETLEPRELIRSVPIAGMALTVPDGAIGSSQLADGAVQTNHIADESITTEMFAEGAVRNAQISLDYILLESTVPDHFEIETEQVLGEVTFEMSYPATYLTWIKFTAHGGGGRSLFYLRDENGEGLCSGNHTSNNVLTVSTFCVFDLPAGTHTLQYTARRASTFVGQKTRGTQTVHLIPLAQMP